MKRRVECNDDRWTCLILQLFYSSSSLLRGRIDSDHAMRNFLYVYEHVLISSLELKIWEVSSHGLRGDAPIMYKR